MGPDIGKLEFHSSRQMKMASGDVGVGHQVVSPRSVMSLKTG
jgi:hypothetical protein